MSPVSSTATTPALALLACLRRAERRHGAPGGVTAPSGHRARPAGRGGGCSPVGSGAVPPEDGRIVLACGPPGWRQAEGAVVAMTEPDAPATMCEAFQHTAARHPEAV